MSETTPSQPNEPQTWKQELRPHHESLGNLTKSETLALMGSWVEESFEGATELHESGTVSDIEYSVKKRVKEAATSELSLLDLEDQNVYSAIAERQKILEEQLYEKGANRLMIRARLDGLLMLNDTYKNIEDHVGSPLDDRHTRAAAINEMIDNHNEWVSRNTETIADNPEIREAQERINARYAEQAKQPQPTETVDDARQKVAEAFGDTGEKEQQTLIGEVVRAAKGSARIHTSVTKETKLRFKGREDTAYNDGFSDFGEGLDWGTHNWRENGAFLSDTSEAFIFEPATTTRKKTVTETIETGGRFRKKTEQVQKEVADGEVPTMIVNPATGQQEPGVNVRYQFDGNTSNKAWGSRSLEKNDLPKYEAPDNNRGGNQLFIEVVLPKSVADTLQQAALRSPDVARQFAQSMLTENGATEATVKMPPYTELPADWTMTVATLQKDIFSDRGRIHTLRNIANRQDVKV